MFTSNDRNENRLQFSSSFEAPPPPTSKGEAVYKDITIFSDTASRRQLESYQQNNDPDAVFIVTGSSRGIGLQYVKSLMDRTRGNIIACCRSLKEDDAHHSNSGLDDYLLTLSPEQRNRIDF